MLKKILAWLLIISTTATIAVGGTLAYLTDRDSEANVFTVGDVDITLNDEFQQESQLKPGVEIEKNISITNEGPNDAYVWYTYAVPQGLEAGLDLSFEEGTKWSAGEQIGTYKDEETGVTYNVYASKYSEAISAGVTTGVGLTKVTMDPAVDITTEGDAYLINAGVPTDLNWNINDTENPVIFINAYAIQTQDFADVDAAYEAFKGQWGDMVAAGTYEVTKADTWDGTADTSWYNDTDTEFTLTTAEQLAGLSELVTGDTTFAGKTVKLGKNIDLYCEDTSASADGDPVTFRPIGDHSKNGTFEGTFDGQGYTVSNLYQNGWDLGYEWGAYGSYGLFGNVNDATIKNLTITGAESYIEGGDVGGVTGSATGTCVFENITIEDSDFATYNNGCGGIIGWSGAGDYTFKNITLGEDMVLAGLWGSFDSSIGGVVGQGEPGATYNFENVDVACRLDCYNDVIAAYKYYLYRMTGMLIGRLEETTTIDGSNYPDMSKYNITCKDVTVTYGDWVEYHYCVVAGKTAWRVEPGYAYGGVPAEHDHSTCAMHCNELLPFEGLFGGDQYGVRPITEYSGVTVKSSN